MENEREERRKKFGLIQKKREKQRQIVEERCSEVIREILDKQ